MTWKNKLEQLITKSEFLFLEQPLKVADFMQEEHVQDLKEYMGLEELNLTIEEQGWTILVFLSILTGYSKGQKSTFSGLLSTMSSGLNDLYHIDTAINTLEVKEIIQKKDHKNRVKQDIVLEVIPSTIDKIMNRFPLASLNRDEILSRKLFILLKDQNIEPGNFHLKETQKIIDAFLESNTPEYVKKLNSYKSIQGDAWYLMFLLIARYYSDGSLSKDMSKAAISIQINSSPFSKSLLKENSRLHQLELIDTVHYEFVNELWVSLSPKALAKLGLLKKNKIVKERNGGSSDMQPFKMGEQEHNFFQREEHSKIEPETLYYNERLQKELDFYKNLLSKEDIVFKRSKAIKGRIILMFDGLPGTGKTAAAQQLAKSTKRDIIHVNWQTFRGQWVGQSEKNLKEMLDQVDMMAMKSKRVPVVLFNEAEAFLSQRIAINQSTDRMENNLVSLLLEWLEKKAPFCIVIFTSNHRQLMDKAFERRISHVNFDAPDEKTRLLIWKSLSAEMNLSDDELDALSDYPLTGAEIARVLNTYSLHQIAFDIQNIDLHLLHSLCKSQKWLEQKTSIGFKTME